MRIFIARYSALAAHARIVHPHSRARKLTDEQRSAIANYFAVYKGQEQGVAKLALALDDHPAIARAYTVLKKSFEQASIVGKPYVQQRSCTCA